MIPPTFLSEPARRAAVAAMLLIGAVLAVALVPSTGTAAGMALLAIVVVATRILGPRRAALPRRGRGGYEHTRRNVFAPGRALKVTRCPTVSVNTASVADTWVMVPAW